MIDSGHRFYSMMLIMNKIVRSKHYILCSLLPLKIDYDNPSGVEIAPELTGKERLFNMFTLNERDLVSKEINAVINASMFGMVTGVVYGGFIRSRLAYLDFIERNQATAFKHHYEAKKALQDYVTVNFAKGAFAWGWRLGLFTGSLVLISTCISVYRGKSGILEYAVAGGVTGCAFRANMGFRGMLVGSLLGTALGFFGGSIMFALLKATGVTMEELHTSQYKFAEYRAEKQQLSFAMEQKDANSDLLECHEKITEGKTVDHLNALLDSSVKQK